MFLYLYLFFYFWCFSVNIRVDNTTTDNLHKSHTEQNGRVTVFFRLGPDKRPTLKVGYGRDIIAQQFTKDTNVTRRRVSRKTTC